MSRVATGHRVKIREATRRDGGASVLANLQVPRCRRKIFCLASPRLTSPRFDSPCLRNVFFIDTEDKLTSSSTCLHRLQKIASKPLSKNPTYYESLIYTSGITFSLYMMQLYVKIIIILDQLLHPRLRLHQANPDLW